MNVRREEVKKKKKKIDRNSCVQRFAENVYSRHDLVICNPSIAITVMETLTASLFTRDYYDEIIRASTIAIYNF